MKNEALIRPETRMISYSERKAQLTFARFIDVRNLAFLTYKKSDGTPICTYEETIVGDRETVIDFVLQSELANGHILPDYELTNGEREKVKLHLEIAKLRKKLEIKEAQEASKTPTSRSVPKNERWVVCFSRARKGQKLEVCAFFPTEVAARAFYKDTKKKYVGWRHSITENKP